MHTVELVFGTPQQYYGLRCKTRGEEKIVRIRINADGHCAERKEEMDEK
jgi:hypothetical protein